MTDQEKQQRADEARYAFMTMMKGFEQVAQAMVSMAESNHRLSAAIETQIAQQSEMLESHAGLMRHMAHLQTQMGVLGTVSQNSELELPPGVEFPHQGRVPAYPPHPLAGIVHGVVDQVMMPQQNPYGGRGRR